MKRQGVIVLTLAVCMLFSLSSMAFAQPNDIKGHWAEKQIDSWVNAGLAGGYADGTFKPDNTITRAEFMALVNRAYGFKATAEMDYNDVKSTDWFASEIAKAKAAGYVSGYQDGTIRPNSRISRQEVASMLTRILKIEPAGDFAAIANLKDFAQIPAWSKAAVNAVVAEGYMGGYPDQTFQAARYITRAEAIVTLDRAKKVVTFDKAGTFGPAEGTETIIGNVTISAADVVLQNTVITGNLLLAASIGDGDVTLKNVTVKGNTVIKGGGANSVVLENCTLPSITVSKDGVRVVASGNTSVSIVRLETGATLVSVSTTGPGFETVTVSQVIPANAKVTLDGNFKNVEVAANDVKVDVAKGKVETLTVAKGVEGAALNVAKGASVGTLDLKSNVTKTGEGKVDNTKAADGVTPPAAEAPATGGGGGGGGGGGDRTAPTLSNITFGSDLATVDGTRITIDVSGLQPEDRINVGTATLSETAYVTVDFPDGGFADITEGIAIDKSTDLMQLIIITLGDIVPPGVGKQKLLENSGTKVTLKDASGNSTTYTITVTE